MYTPLIVLFLVIVVITLLVVFRFRQLKKMGENKCVNLKQILNGGKWKIKTSDAPGSHGLYFMGTFKGRNVQCDYRTTFDKSYFTISSKPRNIPKEVPVYAFKYNQSNVYKDYVLYGDTISTTVTETNPSIEKCNQLLEDLNRACEMVESGNYQLT